MRMMLCHLTGSLRGRTQSFDTDAIRVGVGESCHVAFDPAKDPTVCPLHAEIAVEAHAPLIRDRSGKNALLINGQRSFESELKDGDLLQFGEGGPLVRFRVTADEGQASKPWRAIVTDSRDIVVRMPHPRYLSPLYLARHLLADIGRYGSPAAKLAAILAILTPIVIIFLLGIVAYRQHLAADTAQRRIADLISQLEAGQLTRTEMSRRIEQERQSLADLRRQQEELAARLTASLQEQQAAHRSQQELQTIRRQLSTLENRQRFAEDLVARFGGSVGLLQGGYGFVEQGTGRPLRYQGFDQDGHPFVDREGNPLVTVEGESPPIVIFYAGSGFLVDKAGTILTNRHLVRMWDHYEPAREIMATGFEPRLAMLRIFFPDTGAAFALDMLGVSDTSDVAVLRTDRAPTGLAPLRLAPADDAPRVGEPLVALSYPGTFDSLMGRLAKPVSDGILEEAGGDPVKLADALARRKLIRPLATQGHVSDLSPDTLTFEAGAGGGSSGGPVLDQAGRVIAINHAAMRKVGGLNVGLRTNQARALLAQLRIALDPDADAKVRLPR
ncbi:MAG: FHA domain-containing protein [Nitrospirae bacterium]|nr:MAG: FHA domain-containing protein [Nitrospirota bacterium]